MKNNADNLRPVFWLWIPLVFFAVQIVLEIVLPSKTLSWLQSEGGPHELVEFLLLLAAFVVALMTLTRLNWKKQKWLGVWVLIAAVCCFYVGGEEISWGQQLVHWATPENWSVINDQNETNLHNTSSWLDQKPRLILLLGVLFGGLVFPLMEKFKPGLLPTRFAAIYPPLILAVTSAFLLLMLVIDSIDERLKNIVLFERISEVEELYMFYFVLLYLMILRGRILKHER